MFSSIMENTELKIKLIARKHGQARSRLGINLHTQMKNFSYGHERDYMESHRLDWSILPLVLSQM
jgi:hypothetical protein